MDLKSKKVEDRCTVLYIYVYVYLFISEFYFQYMGASMVLAPATVTYATVNQQDMFNI